MKTQKTIFFSILTLVALCISSCGNKTKEEKDPVEVFRATLTATDTLEMLSLCDNAMECLKSKDYGQFIANLYEYDDSTKTVSELSPETAKRYLNRFKLFPVLSYEREYFSFMLEGCNDVKYSVVFMEDDGTGTGQPARTSFMFNPIKIDGTWKLCVKTDKDMMDREHYQSL